MLEPNRLNPPQSAHVPAGSTPATRSALTRRVFVSADDFDGTGILAGCDPCASNYWWMPELHATTPADTAVATFTDEAAVRQAARRTSARPQAAA